MRSWLFAHVGTIHRFDALKERLLESMPDFLRRNVRGKTDSEPFFHLILSFLHDAGQLDNPDVDDASVVHAIRSSVALVDRLSAEVRAPVPTLNLVLTNGNRMYALRRGAPMIYVERTGLFDPLDPQSATADPSDLRYVLTVSDGVEMPAEYREVEEGGVLVIDRNLRVSVHTP
jgi:glutamine amidotransferase